MRRRVLVLMLAVGFAVAAWSALQAVEDLRVRSGLRGGARFTHGTCRGRSIATRWTGQALAESGRRGVFAGHQ